MSRPQSTLLLLLSCCVGSVAAQTYPQQPLRLAIPFTAGGAADMVGRLVARAAPDGHTLLLVTPTYIINPSLRKLPYYTAKDFAGISMIAVTPLIMVAHPSLPVSDVKQLIALAKAKPSALIYGSAGPGSPTHLGTELFWLSGVKTTHIPYKGAVPGTAPPMEFDRFIRAEIEKWSRVVKEVGLKID